MEYLVDRVSFTSGSVQGGEEGSHSHVAQGGNGRCRYPKFSWRRTGEWNATLSAGCLHELAPPT
jgi:hypothetical protein